MQESNTTIELMKNFQNNPSMSPEKAFLILKQKKLATIKPLDRFIQEIYTEKAIEGQLRTKFTQILASKIHKIQKENHPKVTLSIPFLKDHKRKKHFYVHLLNLYLEEYLHEQGLQERKVIRDLSKPIDEACIYQLNCEAEDKRIKIQKKKQVEGQNKMNQAEMVIALKKAIRSINDKKKQEQIAPFLVYDEKGKQRRSLSILLSFSVTEEFSKEYKLVKQSILQQLKTKNSFLLCKYWQFVKNMAVFQKIKHQRYEDPFQNQQKSEKIDKDQEEKRQIPSSNYSEHGRINLNEYIEEYQSYLSGKTVFYCYPQYKSPLFKYWQEIESKIFKELQENYQNCNIIIDPLFKCLESYTTYLYYTPCSFKGVVYAITSSATKVIAINLNQMESGMTIEQFREGPLKAYLFLCLFHQTAHNLLRQMEIVSEQQKSLDCSYSCIGSKLLKITFDKSQQIKKAYQICGIQNQSYSQKKKRMQGQIHKTYSFLRSHSVLIQRLKENDEIFFTIKQIIVAIQSIYQLKITQQKRWSSLFTSLLERDNDLETQIINKICLTNQQFETFKFIIALIISDSILNKFNLKQVENYNKSIFKLSRCDNFQNLFKRKYTIFTQLAQTIPKKNIELISKKISRFTSFFLSEKGLEELYENLYRLGNVFEDANISTFLSTLQQYNKPISLRCEFLIVEALNKIRVDQKDISIEQGIKVDQIFAKFTRICRVFLKLNNLLQFLKNSQIFLMTCSIPDIILRKNQEKFDAGFYLEEITFPNLKEKIYQKDYQLLQNLNYSNAAQVGVAPQNDVKGQNRYVTVQRSKEKPDCGLYLGNSRCSRAKKNFKWPYLDEFKNSQEIVQNYERYQSLDTQREPNSKYEEDE